MAENETKKPCGCGCSDNIEELKKQLVQFDAHKFSVNEIFSNNNGKTSSTKLVGFITSMVCLLIFLALIVFFFFMPQHGAIALEFVDKTVTYFTVSAGLMGVKSITSAFGKHRLEIRDNCEDKSGKKNTRITEEYSED